MTTQPGAVANRGGRLLPSAVRRSPVGGIRRGTPSSHLARPFLAAASSLLVVLTAFLPAPRADAAPWPTAAARTSGDVKVASWDGVFVPVVTTGLSGTVGGDSLSSANVALGTTAIVDLRNQGTVPALFTGDLTSTAVASLSFSLESCSVRWVNEACPSAPTGRRVIAGGVLPLVGSSRTVDYTNLAPLPPGGVIYLKLNFNGLLLATATVTCIEKPVRVGSDNRTLS